MWIATIDGFYSAVQHREQPDTLIIRARAKADLHNVVPKLGKPKIQATPSADYPFRVEVSKGVWAQYLAGAAEAIDYDNFKNAVRQRQGFDREHVYHRVWAVLQSLEVPRRRTTCYTYLVGSKGSP